MAEMSSWQKYSRPGESQDGPPGLTNHPNRVTLLGIASASPALQGPKNTILVHPTDGGLTAPGGQQNMTKLTWADLKALKLALHLIPWCSPSSNLGESSSKPTVWQAAATL